MQNSNNRISLNFSRQLLLREPILAENFLVDLQGKENQQNNSLVQLFDEQLHIQFKNFHKIIPLNFNVQFQIIYAKKKPRNRISKEIPFGFLLFNGSQVLRMTRYFQGDQIQVWKKQFAKKIIQKGFSDDYKLLKKLKQRNHWIYSIIQNQYSHRKFMCKGITKNNSEELIVKKQLQNQIKIWRKLNHYNLLKLYEVRQTQHSIYLIYEMVEQKCLAKRISQTTFSILQVQIIIKSIIQGLVLLHSKGIIHRNISPEAIFFRKNRDFQCLIGNFQDCCQIQDQSQVCSQLHGTTGYIAPEIFPQNQSNQFEYTFASDMFSVGAILYQLLLGKPLFHGLSKEQKMMQNVSGFMNIKLSDFLLPKHDIYFTAKKEGFSLICKLLVDDPNERLSALEALNHPFFNSDNNNTQKSISKRNSQNIQINKNMLQSRRYLNRNSENVPKPKMIKVQSCQLIESDEQKMDLDHKMVFYHLVQVPKFLSS